MTGEVAALITALCWAIGARLFQNVSPHFSPLSLNFCKGLLAITCLLLFSWGDNGLLSLTDSQLLVLLLSGVIGIGIGDTLFFRALYRISDSRSLLIAETLAPIFTALIAMFWLLEWLTTFQWLGMAIVIFSVDMVIRLSRKVETGQVNWDGYLSAVGAALCQALGAVMSRSVLQNSEVTMEFAALLRLVAGVGVVGLLLMIKPGQWRLPEALSIKIWGQLVLATVIGTVLALFLQMWSLKLTGAAVVQTLFASSVIFSLLLNRLSGKSVPGKLWLWVGISLVGITILVFE